MVRAQDLPGIGYGVHQRGQAFEVDDITPEMVRAFRKRIGEINDYAETLASKRTKRKDRARAECGSGDDAQVGCRRGDGSDRSATIVCGDRTDPCAE